MLGFEKGLFKSTKGLFLKGVCQKVIVYWCLSKIDWNVKVCEKNGIRS